MSKVVNGISIDVDATKFKRDLDRMDQKLRTNVLKKVARNTGTKVIVPALRNYEMTRPHHENYEKTKTGNLRKSFGNITGKKGAVVFSGPRMATGRDRSEGKHKGWVLNILENIKPRTNLKTKHTTKPTNFRAVLLRNTFKAQMEMHRQLKRIIDSI